MNLNINCYDITNQLSKEELRKGTSFIIQIPFKAYKLLKVKDNYLYVMVDIDSLEQSYVQLSFIPDTFDIKYIDPIMNNNPEFYYYLGQYDFNDGFLFLFARVLTKQEIKEIEND